MAIMQWFKVNGYNVVYGSLRLDPPICQLVFIKLLAMASISRVPGTAAIADKVPYPEDILATTLNVSIEELQAAIKHNASPEINRIKINDWGGIEILNWAKYQSQSYVRVRKYRQKKKNQKENRKEIEKNRIEESFCNAPVTPCNANVTTCDKSQGYSVDFLEFWKLWPGRYNPESQKTYKVGKAQAGKIWLRLSIIDQQKVLTVVRSGRVKAAGTQYLPDAFRWLEKKRFEDFGR